MSFRRAYLRRMLLLPLLDFGVTGIFILVTERFRVIGLVAMGLALLAVAAVAAGMWLYRPIAAFESDGRNAGVAARRIQRLPLFSAACAFVFTVAYSFTLSALRVYTPPDATLDHISTLTVGRALLWYAVAYGVFYGFFIYFAVSDLMLSLRSQYRGALVYDLPSGEFRRHGLARKLAAIFLVVGVMPALLIGLDLTLFEPIRTAQGLSLEQVVALDLLFALFVIGAAIVFVSRSLLVPADELVNAQNAVQRGELNFEAAVLTDDELGNLASRFNTMVSAMRERELMKSALNRHLSPSVAAALIAQGGTIESQSTEATVMFTDIEGFTALAEELGPQDTVELLNAYFAALNAIITEAGGTVNNFIGDAVMAIFNVPLAHDAHAKAAVTAAIEITRLTRAKRFTLASGREVSLPTRIGINSGAVFAGVVGSELRQGYTVYGDTVNIAARIEPINKRFQTSILATEGSVALALRQGLSPDCTVSLGPVELRGRQGTVTIYQIVV